MPREVNEIVHTVLQRRVRPGRGRPTLFFSVSCLKLFPSSRTSKKSGCEVWPEREAGATLMRLFFVFTRGIVGFRPKILVARQCINRAQNVQNI